jgi:hypothetical protein
MRIAWRPLAANSLHPPTPRDAIRLVRAVSTVRFGGRFLELAKNAVRSTIVMPLFVRALLAAPAAFGFPILRGVS